MSDLLRLGRPALLSLADALERGRIPSNFSTTSLNRYVPDRLAQAVQSELRDMAGIGMAGPQMAHTLRLLAKERSAAQDISDRVELVWSGTEVLPGGSRSTAVVVQELFRAAKKSVLVSSYSVDTGSKAESLFGTLACRMDEDHKLSVCLFLNVERKYKDETADSVLLREFAERFRHEIWPGERLPEVYYDPRSLSPDLDKRACLHAKCVVIDEQRVLITSANFSEAAHERNIEAGTLITDNSLARTLRARFDTLVDHGGLRALNASVAGNAESGRP